MAQKGKTSPDTLNYKPIFLRWPVLIFLALYIFFLIALLEYGCQLFPSSYDRRAVPNDWNVTATQTAVLSVPLVNRRSTPTARRGPDSGKPGPVMHTTLPTPSPGYLRRQLSNTTHSEQTQVNTTARANTTLALTFAERFGYSPYYLNHTRRNSPGLGRRVPDPSHFGQLSGPTQILTVYLGVWPHINQSYSEIVYFPPKAWDTLSKHAATSNDPETLIPCWITCDGPAIIFHDGACWDIWARLSAAEKNARNTPGMLWRTREDENFAPKCPVFRLQPSPSKELIPVTHTWKPEFTDPVNGHVSTSTWTETTWETREDVHTSVIEQVPVVSGFVTLTDSNGIPTSTSTIVGTEFIRVSRIPITHTDEDGNPILTQLVVPSGLTITLTNAATPTPTAPSPTGDVTTSHSFRNAHFTTQVITAKDTNGIPISTWTSAFAVPWTITNSLGMPVQTIIPGPGQPVDWRGDNSTTPLHPPQSAGFHPMTRKEYYVISFVPILLAIILSIIAQLISSSIRVFLPFHLLTRPEGVSASYSLAMSTSGIAGYINSIGLLFKLGEPMSFLGDFLVVISAIATSLSSEAVGIKLYGSCAPNSFQGCYMGIAVFKEPSRALEGLLAAMLAVVISMFFLLTRWNTGVASNPESIAATASLIQDSHIRKLFQDRLKVGQEHTDHPRFIRQREIIHRLDGHLFCLRHFHKDGTQQYGITTLPQKTLTPWPTQSPLTESTTTPLSNPRSYAPTSISSVSSSIKPTTPRPRIYMYLDKLTHQPTTPTLLPTITLLLISALLILITTYITTSTPTPLENFLNSQTPGVEALFTTFGITLSFFWEYHYSQTVLLHPYRLMARTPRSARSSISISPPVSPFTGLFASICRGEIYPSVVGVAAVLSKFTPTLLVNIPFNPAQTWGVHLVCSWGSVGILGFMGVVVGYGVGGVRYPWLPVGVGCLAGRVWYLCGGESRGVVEGFGGGMGGGRVDGLIGRGRYGFGELGERDGEVRIGIVLEGGGVGREECGLSSSSGSDIERGEMGKGVARD